MSERARVRAALVLSLAAAVTCSAARYVRAEPARAGRATALSAARGMATPPVTLAPLFRAAVAGILLPGAALSPEGELLVATADGDIVSISATGTVRSFATLEESLGHGPVPLSANRFVVAGTKNALLTGKFDTAGLSPLRMTLGRFTPASAGGAPVPPVSDGADGVWFARGARFLHVSGSRVLADGLLPRTLTGLSSLGPLGAAAFDGEGNVFLLGAPGRPPISLGSARSGVEAIPLDGPRALVACSDGALVTVHLDTRKIDVAMLPKHLGNLLIRPGHGAAYVDTGGNLVLLDKGGASVATVALGGRAAEVASLPDGEVAVALSNGEVMIVDGTGSARASGRGCDSPISLIHGPGRLLVACRDGRVLALGDEPTARTP